MAHRNTTYAKVQQLGGNIKGDEVIVEYEKTDGGEKVRGGEVVNAYESYDNRNNVRTVIVDFKNYDGTYRLKAEKSRTEEVTFYSLNPDGEELNPRRISTRDGVTDVLKAEDW